MRSTNPDRDRPLTPDQRLRFATVLVGVFLVMLLVATCGACLRGQGSVSNLRSPVAQYRAAVSIVASCEFASGLKFTGAVGSGVAVSRTQVLTAHHVIEPPENATCKYAVRDNDSTLHPVDLEVDLPDVDLSRMHLSSPGDELAIAGDYSVEVGPRPGVGDFVCAVGIVPFASRFCGYVQWPDMDPEEGHDISHSIIIQPGNSGGPIYDSRGRLVGITTKYSRCGNGQYCGGAGTSLESRSWLVPRR